MNYKKVYTELFNTETYSIHNADEYRYTVSSAFIKTIDASNVIDIGSGRGVFLKTLQRQNPNIKILSTDLDKYNDLDVDFRAIDLSDKGTYIFPDDKYDVLTCLDVLEHMEKHTIDGIFNWFAAISNHQVFTIANHTEIINGKDIHLIKEDLTYWQPIIEKYFTILYTNTLEFSRGANKTPNYLYVFITKPINNEQ